MMTMSSTSLPSDIDPVKAAKVLRDQSDGLKLQLQHDLHSVASTLYSKSIIEQDALAEATSSTPIPGKRTMTLLTAVENSIRGNPQVFLEFIRVLESKPTLTLQAKKLVEGYLKVTKHRASKRTRAESDQEDNLPLRPQKTARMEEDGSAEGTIPESAQRDQATTTASQSSDEQPAHGDRDLRRIAAKEKQPITKVLKKQDPELHSNVEKFCDNVQLLIHTVNENEKWAAFDLLKAPELNRKEPFAEKPIDLFEPNWITLGMFGGYKSALIQTEQGAGARKDLKGALKCFPNAEAIVAVGVLYAFDHKKYKFCDVIVSDFIGGVANYKFARDGMIFFRRSSGSHRQVSPTLVHTFRGAATWEAKGGFECTKGGRISKVYFGEIISGPALVDNLEIRDKFARNAPEARGGEMEAYILGEIEEEEGLSVVVIKAVADYGDGKKAKNWQLTAAMAAAQYAEHKLELTGGKLFVEEI